MSVDVKKFLTRVEEIAAEGPGYQHGHSGDDHLCDCIGLIIGAIRRAGGQWRGTHGTNYAARQEMKYLRKIENTGDLKAGEVVYKAYEPGVGGYDLLAAPRMAKRQIGYLPEVPPLYDEMTVRAALRSREAAEASGTKQRSMAKTVTSAIAA